MRATAQLSAAGRHELQWGHDEGVVEVPVAGTSATSSRLSLQWGHDEGVVEVTIRTSCSVCP